MWYLAGHWLGEGVTSDGLKISRHIYFMVPTNAKYVRVFSSNGPEPTYPFSQTKYTTIETFISKVTGIGDGAKIEFVKTLEPFHCFTITGTEFSYSDDSTFVWFSY